MSDLMKLYCCLHARGQLEVRNRFVGVHLREQIGERVDRFRIADRDGADRARRSVHFPALGRRSEMRLQRSRQRRRCRVDVDDNRALQIDAFEVVDVLLGHPQAVADEDERRFQRRRRATSTTTASQPSSTHSNASASTACGSASESAARHRIRSSAWHTRRAARNA